MCLLITCLFGFKMKHGLVKEAQPLKSEQRKEQDQERFNSSNLSIHTSSALFVLVTDILKHLFTGE